MDLAPPPPPPSQLVWKRKASKEDNPTLLALAGVGPIKTTEKIAVLFFNIPSAMKMVTGVFRVPSTTA